jgi:hypothetical protein
VLPTTEGGFDVDHGAFGLDLAFLAGAMQDANMDPASPFFQHVMPSTALMGHSMGGGASVLGAAGNAGIQTLVNFAAAETGPSAISAAQNVTVPSLFFAGSNDCVTPPPQHQLPMYEALASQCRSYISIIGGGHCHFAASSTLCSISESSCTPTPAITREQQHSVVNDLATLWLDHFLKDDAAAFPAFMDSIAFSTRINGFSTCTITSVRDPEGLHRDIHVHAIDDALVIKGLHAVRAFTVVDAMGRSVTRQVVRSEEMRYDLASLPAGGYRIIFDHAEGPVIRGFVVSR